MTISTHYPDQNGYPDLNGYPDPNQYITYGQMNLINDFRWLWMELAIWLRSYMVSTVTGFSDINAINNQLQLIPEDFKDKLQTVLGVDLAEDLQQFLTMLIVYAQMLITAENNGDQQTADASVSALYKNADAMADFMASINPYWSRNQWQSMLYQLNDMLIAEIIALISADYEKELEIRNRILKHSLMLGDYTASGIMHCLVPDKFPIEK